MEQKAQAVSTSGNNECPTCNGTGWELFQQYVEEYECSLTFARHCSKCSGQRHKDFTRVPEQFADADIGKFDFDTYPDKYSNGMEKLKKIAYSMLNDWKEWDMQSRGLYLWSKTPGSGKTFLACCLGKSIMVKHNLQMRFISTPNYISLVGESFKRERGETDESETFRNCKLLILDDIGSQIGREWQSQELFKLIDKRNTEGKITIYTSNMAPENLNLEDRVKSRIIDRSIVIQMPEESIRLRKSQQRQQKFLQALGI